MNTTQKRQQAAGKAASASEPLEVTGLVLAAALIATTLVFEPWLEDAFSLPKNIALQLGALVSLAVLFWRHPAGAAELLRPRGQDAPVLAFLAVCAFHTVVSLNPHQSFFGQYQHYSWGLWSVASGAAIYWCFSRLPARASLSWLWRAVLVSGAAVLLYTALQRLGLDPVPWKESSQTSPISVFGGAIKYAPFLLLLVPFTLSRLFTSRGAAGRVLWGAVLCAITYELLQTLRRGAWLGTLVAAALWFAFNFRVCLKTRRTAWAMAALLGALVLGNWAWGRTDVRDRMEVFLSRREGSASARLDLWKMSLRIIRDHKGVGTGLDTYGFLSPRYETIDFRRFTGARLIATNAHNEVLQVAVTLGLAGLAAYLWMLLSFARLAAAKLRDATEEQRLLLTPLLAAFAGLWVHALFNFNTASVIIYWWAFMGVFNAQEGSAALPQADRRPNRLAAAACLLALLAASIYSVKAYIADKSFKRAYASVRRSQWDKALMYGERALRLNPWGGHYALPVAHAYRGKALMEPAPEARAALFAKAAAAFKAHMDRYPLDADAHHNYAMSLMWGAFDKADDAAVAAAVAEERKAVELAPLYPDFWSSLGQVYHFAGRVDEAKAAWIRTLDLSPGYREAAAWIEKYAPKLDFKIAEQDLVIEDFPLGKEVDLASLGKSIKIANLEPHALHFQLSRLPDYLTTYQIPEGYAVDPAEAEMAPETWPLTVESSDVVLTSAKLFIPEARRFAGRKFCFFIKIRCVDFDVPVERVVRVLVTTQRREK